VHDQERRCVTDATLLDARRWLDGSAAEVRELPLPDQAALPYPRLQMSYAPWIARVKDATVLPGEWLLLSSRGELLLEHLHQSLHLNPRRSRYIQSVSGDKLGLAVMDPTPTIQEPCVLLGNRAMHYHWLVDYLPRVYAAGLVPETAGLRFVVGADLTAQQEESLHLLGVGAERLLRIDPARPARFASLWVPSLLAEEWYLHPAALHWLRTCFAKTEPQAERGCRLFVSRRDADTRRLVNQDAIELLLRGFGYRTVVGSALDFAAQVETFRRAESIVAVTGSALANLIFSPRGATVIELHNVPEGAEFFGRLARQLDMRYGRLHTETIPVPGTIANNYDFRIDAAVLEAGLREIHGVDQGEVTPGGP
jgi:capsular polysaccharide biosynthesis protein